MNRLIRRLPIIIALLVGTAAWGAVPPINVVVSDSSGKLAFKGTTDANGSFTTGKLGGATYVVQFTSTNPALKGHQYSIALSAGKAKVAANAVPAEKFAGNGLAMKIVTGETAAEARKKHPEINSDPAAIRALERSEREYVATMTGRITEGKK